MTLPHHDWFVAMSPEIASNTFVFPIRLLPALSLPGHILPIQAHLVVLLAIVKLFNLNLLVWPCRSTFSVSLIETSSHVIPIAFRSFIDSFSVFICSLSCFELWRCTIDSNLVPQTLLRLRFHSGAREPNMCRLTIEHG